VGPLELRRDTNPRRCLRVLSVSARRPSVTASGAQREPAPVERIASCRAPSTGTVNEAHRPEARGALRLTDWLGVSRARIRASYFRQKASLGTPTASGVSARPKRGLWVEPAIRRVGGGSRKRERDHDGLGSSTRREIWFAGQDGGECCADRVGGDARDLGLAVEPAEAVLPACMTSVSATSQARSPPTRPWRSSARS
jgi:hypothetical protein